jgi:LCP family protein required for cell wall assembly
VLGGIKSAASGAGNLAKGAAVATGVTAPSNDALTILVMGVDARPGAPIDVSVRPDALMVLRLDPASGSCRGLAIPRDTLVELPGYGQTKINHALMVGGIPYQLLVVERFLGIAIDRYALIDFTGFQELVDAVGGVPVTVPQTITKNGQTLFAAGSQTFDGTQALAYARYRGGSDVDVGRGRRQQQIIRGLIGVAAGRDAVREVNRLLPALEEHIRTDLSPAELVAVAEHYRTTCAESELQLDSLQGNFQQIDAPDPIFKRPMTYNVVDPETIRSKVAALTKK